MTTAGSTGDRRTGRRVAFVLEQHLGHRTYADNLRDVVDSVDDIEALWVPITYEPGGGAAERLPVGGQVRSILRARHEMQPARRAAPDVYVFNTQVPAAIGSRAVRRPPYIAITDVTPRQYDRMADGYDHRPDRWMPIAAAKHAWNRRVFQRAAWTVGWSSWVRDSLVDEYSVEPERAVVIPPGVDTTRWTPGADDRRDDCVRYLFVGGDFERKGGAALLRAFAKLPPDEAELTLVTKSQVAPTPSVQVVNDLGPNDPRLIELYRSSDVFVLPSRSETFGIAAVEAIASGLPVVATDVGGLPDIVVDGETGFTVPPGDVDALAERLVRLHDSVELRRRLGGAAHRRAVERFDARTNASRLVGLVRECLGDRA